MMSVPGKFSNLVLRFFTLPLNLRCRSAVATSSPSSLQHHHLDLDHLHLDHLHLKLKSTQLQIDRHNIHHRLLHLHHDHQLLLQVDDHHLHLNLDLTTLHLNLQLIPDVDHVKSRRS